MIVKKNIETRTCDVCGIVVSTDGNPNTGGSIFKGWHHIEKTNGATSLLALNTNNTLDVCSMDCLLNFSINWHEYPKVKPLPEYNGERVFSTYLVTVELINNDKNDENEVTLAIWDCLDATWRYYVDRSKKYGECGWNVIAWAKPPKPYNIKK